MDVSSAFAYGRVSSVSDQFRICREHAGREGWQVVDSYQEAAISDAGTEHLA
jgi:site-specific DNA recombinase